MATFSKDFYTSSTGERFPLVKSAYCSNFSPLRVSDYMSGKMSGIPSVSTSCLENPICQARMRDGDSICAHCFASATLTRYMACGENCASNLRLLMNEVIPLDMLPRFVNVSIVRIESFGDVANVTQAVNYANMCKVNPRVIFAWWSKNMPIINQAFDIVGKPRNVVMIQSSEKLNVPTCQHEIADKVFTVYDDATIEREAVSINCGARSCASCRRCYSKRTGAVVSERLK